MAIRFASTATVKNKLPKTSNFWDGTAVYSPLSYASIATVTVGSGGSSAVSFASITSAYKHLQLRVTLNTTSAINEFVKFWYNNDTTTANYANNSVYATGSSVSMFSSNPSSGRAYHLYQVANGFQQPLTAVIDILDYTDTSKYRTTRLIYGSNDNAGGKAELGLLSGLYISTTAINRIDFSLSSGSNFPQYSSFALYGIKGA